MSLSPTDPAAPTTASAPPPLALALGYAGLLPFLAGALLTWIVRPDAHPYVTDALAKYAALIATFLGGMHWGLVLRPAGGEPSARLGWGVAVMLAAWVAVLMPPYAGLALLGALLVACYLVDRRAYAAAGAAGWLTLRFRLSAVAALSCFLAAAGS